MTSPLPKTEILDVLQPLNGWELEPAGIRCRLKFKDFQEAFSFMTEVALVAEKMNHHPHWSNCWSAVDIRLSTHEAGGITTRDLDMARQIHQLLLRRGHWNKP